MKHKAFSPSGVGLKQTLPVQCNP